MSLAFWMAMHWRALQPWVYLFEGMFLTGLPEGKLNMEVLGLVIRWVVLTFPRYQCNELGISEGRGRIGKIWSEEDNII